MILDLENCTESELPVYDLCIVGSGPAGTSVAAELRDSGLKICVLESGLERVTDYGDDLRRVESEGIYVKDYSRERVLGGASTTWAGLAAPLDEIDFEPRPWLECSGWPIEREELVPYWAAAERYRFPSSEAFGTDGFGALRAKGSVQPEWEHIEEKVFLAPAEAQNFGREWRHLYETEGVDAYLDATVLELTAEEESDEGGRRVEAARVRTRGGREFEVRARVFVIATGGIENARILLNSTENSPTGLGNEHDQVGRYLMNHPKNYHGILHLERPLEDLPYFFGCMVRGFAGYAGLRLEQSYQRERELLNSYVRFEPLFPWTDSQGVEALVLFAKRSAFLMRSFRRGRGDEVVSLRDYSETGDDSEVQNARKTPLEWLRLALSIPADAGRVARYLKYRLITKAKPKITRVRLRNFMEMEPRAENRVTLSETLDACGRPRPLVRHDSSAADRRSMCELHEVLRRELEAQGFGRLESQIESTDPWPIDEEASHHVGTTKMGDDPETSVVDANCRVHSAANIYMAGASVFPTSGCANPTFTIVALSIRLAEHLRHEVFQLPR